MQLLFVSLILLCPSDFSGLYKARTHIQMEFHPKKEIPILKGIAQQSATICKIDVDYNKTRVLIPNLTENVRSFCIIYFHLYVKPVIECLIVNCAVCVNVLTN